jgi:hypothetical protein
MTTLRIEIARTLPYISVIAYGGEEYVGIMINQDKFVTSIYDLSTIKTGEERTLFLKIGADWWWESNRKIPISVFCREQISLFSYAIKTFNSKDVRIILGPVVNLADLTAKRIRRKSVQVIKTIKK